MILLFDAANTLIHKPSFYLRFREVLQKYGFNVDPKNFHKLHKIISELYHFPDRTSKDFYSEFNCEVLYALGIIPDSKLLEDLFTSCSYLPWEKFEDTKYIMDMAVTKAVLSNFHNGLNKILEELFGDQFVELIISETEDLRKPDLLFYRKAIEKLGVKASEIMYIGDSVKLDLHPGIESGMDAWIIDRNNYYPDCKKRLESLSEIKNLL